MSTPRIIAGKARGIRLQDVPGEITRPITDRVKEALFNIIGPDILDATLLDLFGGTGSVGIEALSRGAAFVQFVDLNRPAVDTIRKNLALTHLSQNADVIQRDAFLFLAAPPARAFDYIFIAPPQYKKMWIKSLQTLDQNPGWLAEDGWIIVQIDPVEDESITLQHWEEFDRRRYGTTLLLFYSSKPGSTDSAITN